MKVVKGRSRRRRSGAALIELALLLPALAGVCGIAADYSRLFYALATLSDSARAGAVYAATHPGASAAMIQQVALKDTTDLSPQPTVTSTGGTDGSGNATVHVTVTYTFQPALPNPAIPSRESTLWTIFNSPTTLSRTVVMMVNPG
jgi:Flp pilus assembly protein TadG